MYTFMYAHMWKLSLFFFAAAVAACSMPNTEEEKKELFFHLPRLRFFADNKKAVFTFNILPIFIQHGSERRLLASTRRGVRSRCSQMSELLIRECHSRAPVGRAVHV